VDTTISAVATARLEEQLVAINGKLDRIHVDYCRDRDLAWAERGAMRARIDVVEDDVIRLKVESRIVTGLTSLAAAVVGVFVKPG